MLLIALVLAAPLEDGERLRWAVTWLGIEAGEAWSVVRRAADGWVVEAGCRNAGWLDRLYPIDDWMLSEFGPGGSRRYRTRFREGRFHQDQDMRLSAPEVLVSRAQEIDGAWKSSEARYPYVPGAEDPISAVFRLRVDTPAPGESFQYPVFNGKRTMTLLASASADTLDGVVTRRVEVSSLGEGDYDGAVVVWLSEDADRVPLKTSVKTRAGWVDARLRERTFEGR